MRGNKRYLTRKQRGVEPEKPMATWEKVVAIAMIIGGIIYLIFKG